MAATAPVPKPAPGKPRLIRALIESSKWFLVLGLAAIIAGLSGLVTSTAGKQIDRKIQQCALAEQIVTAGTLNPALPIAMSRKLVQDAAQRVDRCVREELP